MSAKPSLKKREKRLCGIQEALDILFRAHGGQEQRHLNALWNNWDMVLGEDLAQLGAPLGHKDRMLQIGAEDSMALQELSLQSPDILDRVNAFMDGPFFVQVRVILLQGQRALNERRPARSLTPLRPCVPPRPPRLGALSGTFPPGSLVASCYDAYISVWR